MQDLLLGMLAVIHQADFQVDVPWAKSSGAWLCTSKNEFVALVVALACVSKTACSVAFALEKLVGKPPENLIDKEAALRPEVNFVTEVFSQVGAPLVALLGPAGNCLRNRTLSPSLDQLKGWFDRASSLSLSWGRLLHGAAAARMRTIAQEVQSRTPVCYHFITDSKVAEAMVKRSLLSGQIRQALSDRVILLHKIRELEKKWKPFSASTSTGVSPDAAKDEEAECARIAFEAGRAALTVIACCSVVFEGGEGRAAEAETLTAVQRPEVPRALWARVERLAAKTPAKTE